MCFLHQSVDLKIFEKFQKQKFEVKLERSRRRLAVKVTKLTSEVAVLSKAVWVNDSAWIRINWWVFL